MNFNIYDIVILVFFSIVIVLVVVYLYKRRGKGCNGCDAKCSEQVAGHKTQPTDCDKTDKIFKSADSNRSNADCKSRESCPMRDTCNSIYCNKHDD